MYNIIEELRSNNSRLFKEQVLEKHKDNPYLKKVLYYALSPRKQFYIRKIPKYIQNLVDQYPNSIFDLLDDLHDRKITGNHAIQCLKTCLEEIDVSSAKLLELIVQKDLKCGVNVSTVNKIFPNLIEETPYQRCCLLKEMKKDSIDWENGLYSQEKLDGMFSNMVVGSKKQVLSRNGSSFPLDPFKEIIQNIEQYLDVDSRDLVFHGELVVYSSIYNEPLKREIGNGILNSLLKVGEFDSTKHQIRFIVWDVLTHNEFFQNKSSNTPYKDRFKTIENLFSQDSFPVSSCPTKIVYSFEQAKQHYKELALQGKEGTVLKTPNSPWKDGTSKQMWKFKVEAEAELKVVGFNQGNGKNQNLFGSLICQSSDGLLEVNVSGFSDQQRQEISENKDFYLDKICSVVYNNIMETDDKKASMFLPRFKEWRFDKSQANSLQEIKDIFESVLEK